MGYKRRRNIAKKQRRRDYKISLKNRKLKDRLYYRSLCNADFNIFHLSEDLWIEILSYLPTANIIRMKTVSRFFSFLLSNPRYDSDSVEHGFSLFCTKKAKKNPLTSLISEQQLELYHSTLYNRVDFGNPYLSQGRRSCLFHPNAESVFRPDRIDPLWIYSVYNGPHVNPEQTILGPHPESRLDIAASSAIDEKGIINTVLEHANYIETIILNGCDAVNDTVIQLISEMCQRLKHLEMRGCINVTNMSLEYLRQGSATRKTLETLVVTQCPLVDDCSLEESFEFLRGYHRLARLEFGHQRKNWSDILGPLIDEMNQQLYDLYADELKKSKQKQDSYTKDIEDLSLEDKQIIATRMREESPPCHPGKLYNLYNTLTEIVLDVYTYMPLLCIPLITLKFSQLEKIEMYFCGGSLPGMGSDMLDIKKAWEEAKKNTTLKHLVIHDGAPSTLYDFTFESFVELYPDLEVVQFADIGDADNVGRFLKCHKKLKSFTLCGDCSMNAFKELDLSLNLHALQLRLICEAEEHIDSFANFIDRYCQQLQILSLKILPATPPQGLDKIGYSIRGCDNLRDLSLDSIQFSSHDSFFLSDWPQYFPKLKKLTLSDIGFVNGALNEYDPTEAPIYRNMTLDTLSVTGCSIGVLHSFFNRLGSLRHLNIQASGDLTPEMFGYLINQETASRVQTLVLETRFDFISLMAQIVMNCDHIALQTLVSTFDSCNSLVIKTESCNSDAFCELVTKAGRNMRNIKITVDHLDDNLCITMFKNCPALTYIELRATNESCTSCTAKAYENFHLPRIMVIKMPVNLSFPPSLNEVIAQLNSHPERNVLQPW